jgi:hypothetical protein
MTTTEADNGNGRITLALIGQKLDHIIEIQRDTNACIQRHEGRLSTLEQGQAQRIEQIHTLKEEVTGLRARDTTGNWVTGAMAMIAGLIGVFKP